MTNGKDDEDDRLGRRRWSTYLQPQFTHWNPNPIPNPKPNHKANPKRYCKLKA